MTDYSSAVDRIEELDREATQAAKAAREYVRSHSALEPAKAAAEVTCDTVYLDIVDDDTEREGVFLGFKVTPQGTVRIRYRHSPSHIKTNTVDRVDDQALKEAIQRIGGSEFVDVPVSQVREATAERRDMASLLPDEVTSDE
jgi:spore coat polysaccharide biosynthesis protein SpsF (cytidylyltransferase family)